MTRGFVPLILLASFLYAATYLFIKVAVDEIAPATMVSGRLLLAAPIFGLLLSVRGGRGAWVGALREAGRAGVLIGILSFAVPLTLLGLGEKWVDSGVAAIGIASTPIFVQLLARRFRPSERVGGLRLAGILLGLVGVGLLAGAAPGGDWAQIGGTVAVLGSALSFALGMLYMQTSLARSNAVTIAAASSMWGGLLTLPLGLAELPHYVPGWKAIGAVLALLFVNSIVAQLLGFHIIRRFGAARNSLATYLTPPMALIVGALALDESITVPAVGGLALILVGVALGSGVLRFQTTAPTPAPMP